MLRENNVTNRWGKENIEIVEKSIEKKRERDHTLLVKEKLPERKDERNLRGESRLQENEKKWTGKWIRLSRKKQAVNKINETMVTSRL